MHAIVAGAESAGSPFIVDLFVILATAAAVAMLMQRIRVAAVPGYLLTGVVLGPHAVGLVQSPESLGAISNLAIILLMFGIGLHMDLSILRHQLSRMIAAGAASCGLTTLVGAPVAMLFGLPPAAALLVAMALSLSSTAVVLRLIADRRELHHTTGRLTLSILVVQDLLVLLMLASVPALARWGGGESAAAAGGVESSWMSFLATSALRVGGLAALVVVGRKVLPLLLHESTRGRSLEILMIVAVAVALAAALATSAMGFSPELGAFLSGFLLSGTSFRHQIEGQIGPLRDLFIAVFFTTVGMKLDPRIAAESWWIILLGGALMTGLKAAIIGGTVWGLGASAAMAGAVGFTLAQGGEFSLVLLDAAQRAGLLGETTVANCGAIIIVSLIITPGLLAIGRSSSRLLARFPPAPWVARSMIGDRESGLGAGESRPRVIVAGFGPIGRRTTERLIVAGYAVTVIELNPVTVRDESRQGRSIVYGDAASEEVLRSAGIEGAAAMVLTIPDEQAVARACAAAKHLSPGVMVVARTASTGRARAVAALGADHVISEEEATAEAMERLVCERLPKGNDLGGHPAAG